MGKSPSSGSRSKSSVAKGKSPSYDTNSGRGYSGQRGTKTPSGGRPVPSVARNTPPHATVPGATKPATKRTSMPRPNAAASQSAKGRAHGA